MLAAGEFVIGHKTLKHISIGSRDSTVYSLLFSLVEKYGPQVLVRMQREKTVYVS